MLKLAVAFSSMACVSCGRQGEGCSAQEKKSQKPLRHFTSLLMALHSNAAFLPSSATAPSTPAPFGASQCKRLVSNAQLRTAEPRMTNSVEPKAGDATVMKLCAAGWLALTIPVWINARSIMENVFGLDQTTFEATTRQPAGAYLKIFSSLFPLEAVFLLALASSSEALDLDDRSRIGVSLALTSAGVCLLFVAAMGGVAVSNPTALVAFGGLNLATAVVAAREATRTKDPLEVIQSDLTDLLAFDSDTNGLLSFFYRSSAVAGIIVAASAIFSPVSPLSVFDEELPVTHMLRQDLGVYIGFLLCAAEAALYRAVQAKDLAQPQVRALNVLTGISAAGLVLTGRTLVEESSTGFQALQPGDPFLDALLAVGAVGAGNSRAEVNTTYPFLVGIIVGCVYISQAITNKPVNAKR